MAQGVAASHLGITQSALCNYEKGNRQLSAIMLAKMGRLYRVRVSKLLLEVSLDG
jgi:transcriptional regulator with XRE-family HTH domain